MNTESLNETALQCENKLLQAMRHSDVAALDELLHNDLMFVIPSGMVISKEIDLDNFRNGDLKISSITNFEYHVQLVDDCILVTVNTELRGMFYDQRIDGNFRYFRVWKEVEGRFQIIGGSGTPIME